VVAAGEKLDEIKRFDMPEFVPNEHYIREMQRYGVLPDSFDPFRDALRRLRDRRSLLATLPPPAAKIRQAWFLSLVESGTGSGVVFG
jgi:hypothetical protein